MERRALGRTGLDVPVIGLGTAKVFNQHGDAGQARCEVVIDAALDAGATVIDTSPMYGEAEAVVARALAERRHEAVVATKVWARTRAVGEQQIERALDWFGVVDLYQVHNLLAVSEYLPILKSLVATGRVRAVGVTHYLPSMFPAIVELIRSGQIDCVQVPYHPRMRDIESEVLPAAAEMGVGVVAMTPLASGNLMENPPPESELEPLASAGVQTWAQALLKWCLSDRRISCAVPATGRPEHMRENASAGVGPWLDSGQRRLVETLAARALDPEQGPESPLLEVD